MKKILKSRIFLVIITAIVFTGIGVLATVAATSITYEPSWTKVNGDPITNVQEALDTLYTKATTPKVATQVATLTTQGATYTMENDGYITGTMAATVSSGTGADIFINDVKSAKISYDDSETINVSIYAASGTVVRTRSTGGTYNLTVYEWK